MALSNAIPAGVIRRTRVYIQPCKKTGKAKEGTIQKDLTALLHRPHIDCICVQVLSCFCFCFFFYILKLSLRLCCCTQSVIEFSAVPNNTDGVVRTEDINFHSTAVNSQRGVVDKRDYISGLASSIRNESNSLFPFHHNRFSVPVKKGGML